MGDQKTNDTVASQQPSQSQQSAGDELAFQKLKLGDAWGESITKNRASELEAMLQAWEAGKEHRGRKGPFDIQTDEMLGVPLTGADVFWLAMRLLACTNKVKAVESAAERILSGDTLNISKGIAHHVELSNLHLGGASLRDAHLEGAYLFGAHLEKADLNDAHLEGANLNEAHLEGAYLLGVHLEGATLIAAHLEGANLNAAHLEQVGFTSAHLEGATLIFAHLEQAGFTGAHLESATLTSARLQGAYLNSSHLGGAALNDAHLEGASLSFAHLKARHVSAKDTGRIRRWASDFPDMLPPTDMRLAYFDSGTVLNDAILGDEKSGYVTLADARWGNANLAVVNWTRTTHGLLGIGKRIEAIQLGDEREAREYKDSDGKPKDKATRLQEYMDAVRANRQLATALRQQGLNEDSDRFAFCAQVLQRDVFRLQGNWGRFAFWMLLQKLAGYGYRPMNTLLWYLTLLVVSTLLFWWQGMSLAHPTLTVVCLTQKTCNVVTILPPTWYQLLGQSIAESVTAVHGRGFFQGAAQSGLEWFMAAFDAVAGLIIEASFIATFVQRFYAR